MTIKEVIDVLDAFRDEYNLSTDPEVKKLCKFVSDTIDTLNKYTQFFSSAKLQIERSQSYYSEALDTINKLLQDSDVQS